MKAIETISRFDMIHRGDTVLAGVSGGADSMALLHLLCSLRGPMELTVCAAHINHGLRGEEAARDEDFVRLACEDWKVELFVLRADVRAEAQKTGGTVEEAGRRVRYGFFKKTAEERGAKIATAHTLSDSIETLLLNLARGTGLKGLCGIPPIREGIIRPLIETTRLEVEEYCEKNSIKYMNDSTNFSRAYTRNRLRLDVIPVLYEINPAFDRSALRAMRSFAQDEALLGRMAHEQLTKACTGEHEYDAAALRTCPPELMHRVLSLAAAGSTGTAQEAVHIEKLQELLECGGVFQLKGGHFASVKDGKLSFCADRGLGQREGFCVPLEPGSFKNEAFGIEISFITKNEIKNFKNFNKRYLNNVLDCDRIIGKAVIRSKMPGEGFSPAGRGVSKTLKKLFNEAGIPPGKRELLPVVSDQKGIAWVYGFGPDERCKVTDETERAVYFKTADMGG